MRFFATANIALYEQTRLGLDAAWGLPNDRGTQTCINPAPVAPRDAAGRVLLAVASEWCEWEPAATILPQLLAAGFVEEITAEQYHAVTVPSLQTAPASAFPGGSTTINGTLGGFKLGG